MVDMNIIQRIRYKRMKSVDRFIFNAMNSVHAVKHPIYTEYFFDNQKLFSYNQPFNVFNCSYLKIILIIENEYGYDEKYWVPAIKKYADEILNLKDVYPMIYYDF